MISEHTCWTTKNTYERNEDMFKKTLYEQFLKFAKTKGFDDFEKTEDGTLTFFDQSKDSLYTITLVFGEETVDMCVKVNIADEDMCEICKIMNELNVKHMNEKFYYENKEVCVYTRMRDENVEEIAKYLIRLVMIAKTEFVRFRMMEIMKEKIGEDVEIVEV